MTPLSLAAAPIVQAALAAAKDAPVLLGIDGRCGSGKTTLANWLAQQLHCPVLHTDDFYLPLSARCENWQQQLCQLCAHTTALPVDQ